MAERPGWGWASICSNVGSVFGTGVVDGTTVDKIVWMKCRMDEVKTLMKNEKERFSAMTDWLICPEELENAINPLLDCNVLKEIAQEVQKFTEAVTDQINMSEDEFTMQFKRVLKHCMGQMAKDSKVKKEYGKELAPAVMAFVFVVCLMNDHNRITLGCSVINQHMALDLMRELNFGTLAGELIGGSAIAKAAISETFVWFALVIDLLNSAQSFIDVYKRPHPEYTKRIKEAAEKFEKIFSHIERVYNDAKTYNSRTNVSQWKTFLVSRAPDDAGHGDLRMAVKHYLPEEALGRIKIIRLPTEERNWLVKVPAIHSLMLLQQTLINIKGRDCAVTQ
ncbi:hypothetical protein AVEN_25539-1 [Araneus ventricosus]|uniref:Uncharacterized protein n=1 Tax=Araneus ventricosus TaxID=182803 RepID=A0A4Y2T061_ARAVE|nr:hypothetical protein AVEN_25539-1 [Araneus ventricosus]